MFARYAGSRIDIDGGEIKILNDDEIIAVVPEPESILHNFLTTWRGTMQNEMTTDRAEELVPLDTDGNEVEVELEESKVTEVIEEEATPEPEAVEEEDSSEHEEYSKKVETRINKLTAKLREAERREEAATTFAKSMQERK